MSALLAQVKCRSLGKQGMGVFFRFVSRILLIGILTGCQGRQQLHPFSPAEPPPVETAAALPSAPSAPPAAANFEGALDHTWPGGTGAIVGVKRQDDGPYRGFEGSSTSSHDNGQGETITTAFDFVLLDSNDMYDTYRVTRRLHNGEQEQRTFQYGGQPVTVFDDAHCKTVVRPLTPMGF